MEYGTIDQDGCILSSANDCIFIRKSDANIGKMQLVNFVNKTMYLYLCKKYVCKIRCTVNTFKKSAISWCSYVQVYCMLEVSKTDTFY